MPQRIEKITHVSSLSGSEVSSAQTAFFAYEDAVEVTDDSGALLRAFLTCERCAGVSHTHAIGHRLNDQVIFPLQYVGKEVPDDHVACVVKHCFVTATMAQPFNFQSTNTPHMIDLDASTR